MKVPDNQRSKLMKVSATAIGATLCVLAASGTAFAAGNGYSPSAAPPSAVAGGFTKIVTTKTIHLAGGKLQGAANGATALVLVPAGALPGGGQVVLSDGPLGNIKVGKGLKVVSDFSVVIVNPSNGARLSGPWKLPITITIHDPSIRVGDKVVSVTSPGHVTTITKADVKNGFAIITFTNDPNFAVVQRT